MMQRYLAVIAIEHPSLSTLSPSTRGEIGAGMQVVCDEPDLWFAADSDVGVYEAGTQGSWVIGRVHSRDAAMRPIDVRASLSAREYDIDALLRDFWGDFVGFMRRGDATLVTIVRSALGRLPCLYARHGNRLLVASDTRLLRGLGLPQPELDLDQLAHRLAYRELPAARTCLSGIEQLTGGHALTLAGELAHAKTIWTPWNHAGPEQWLQTWSHATDLVTAKVLEATRARTQGSDRQLLLLSGGFDSSVLAAAMATRGSGFACLNLTYTGGAADERAQARAVAKRLGCELHEAQWSAADIDLARSDTADRPDPVGRSFMQGTNRVLGTHVERIGADCVVDGGGGDNVFCAMRSVAPIADAWRFAATGEAWDASRTLARLAQVSIGAVLKRAAARALRRSPGYRWYGDTRFLAQDVSAAVSPTATHPWLDPPSGATPGTAAQVALVAALQGWAEEPDLITRIAHVSPLATQPVVEACLSIPSWWWLRADKDRAVAREAFSSRLPAAIVTRCAKGSPDPFLADIYSHNRTLIRAMLLDGGLQRLGLIDREAVEAATRSDVTLDATYLRLLHLVDAEAWLAAQS